MENTASVSLLCGANDTNLRYMEKLLDVSIVPRGNELLLAGGNSTTRQMFLNLVNSLKQHLDSGFEPSTNLIDSIYSSLTEGNNGSTVMTNRINIPGREKHIFPRSPSQNNYIRMMEQKQLVFAVGPAGSGKTFLAVAYALAQVLSDRKRKLIMTRPVIETGERLGYLPGDLTQKLHPYLRPLYDAMELLLAPSALGRLEERTVIEIAPLAYMRGRSLDNCTAILDEAQNTTIGQMKMFLTRIGINARVIVTGDDTQIDLPINKKSGLLHALNILAPIRDIGIQRFTKRDIVRSPLVRQIVEKYEGTRKPD